MMDFFIIAGGGGTKETLSIKSNSHLEIIKNVLVCSFCFIWIPMLWVYDHYKYVYSFSAGIDFSRQNLTSIDVGFRRIKSILAL